MYQQENMKKWIVYEDDTYEPLSTKENINLKKREPGRDWFVAERPEGFRPKKLAPEAYHPRHERQKPMNGLVPHEPDPHPFPIDAMVDGVPSARDERHRVYFHDAREHGNGPVPPGSAGSPRLNQTEAQVNKGTARRPEQSPATSVKNGGKSLLSLPQRLTFASDAKERQNSRAPVADLAAAEHALRSAGNKHSAPVGDLARAEQRLNHKGPLRRMYEGAK